MAIGAVRSREEAPLHKIDVDLRPTPLAKGVQETKLEQLVKQGLFATVVACVDSMKHDQKQSIHVEKQKPLCRMIRLSHLFVGHCVIVLFTVFTIIKSIKRVDGFISTSMGFKGQTKHQKAVMKTNSSFTIKRWRMT